MSILGIAITTILGLLGIAAIIIGFFGGETYLVWVFYYWLVVHSLYRCLKKDYPIHLKIN